MIGIEIRYTEMSDQTFVLEFASSRIASSQPGCWNYPPVELHKVDVSKSAGAKARVRRRRAQSG